MLEINPNIPPVSNFRQLLQLHKLIPESVGSEIQVNNISSVNQKGRNTLANVKLPNKEQKVLWNRVQPLDRVIFVYKDSEENAIETLKTEAVIDTEFTLKREKNIIHFTANQSSLLYQGTFKGYIKEIHAENLDQLNFSKNEVPVNYLAAYEKGKQELSYGVGNDSTNITSNVDFLEAYLQGRDSE